MSIRDIEQSGGYNYTYSDSHEPIARVQIGERVRIHCVDCFENRIDDENLSYGDVCEYPYVNPQTGPIFVEGVESGDTLLVRIDDIEITRDWAITGLVPYFGLMTGTQTTATINAPLPEVVRKLPIHDGRVWYDERCFPVNPFMGTIGTAPRLEAINALTPSYYGGNMDCPEARPGNTMHFPVRAKGGLFFCGDGHAVQGHGEIGGVACEVPVNLICSFGAKKGENIDWPRVTNDEFFMTIGCARPLEDAARIACRELVKWVAGKYELEEAEALILLYTTT